MTRRSDLSSLPSIDEKFYELLSGWLRKARLEAGLSLEHASEALAWDVSVLKYAEETGLISSRQVRLIANVYNLDQDLVLGQVLKLYLTALMEPD